MYSIIECVLLSQSGCVWRNSGDSLVKAAGDVVQWRIDNGFSWNHDIREQFWSKLCQMFPAEMLPKGTVTAAIDAAVDYLARIAPVEVVVRAKCFQCQTDMGWFAYQFENSLEINTTNMKIVPDCLAELYLAMISRQMRKLLGPGGKRVKCISCGNWGAAVPDITLSNLHLPPVLMFGFLVRRNGPQTVKCKMEDSFMLGTIDYNLTGVVLSQPMHFVAVTRIEDKFYNLDNLDDSEGKKSFSTFKGALINKEASKQDEVVLDKRTSETRRAGAIQYAVYTGTDYLMGEDFQKYSSNAQNLNDLLVRKKVETLIVPPCSKDQRMTCPIASSFSPAEADLQPLSCDEVVTEIGRKQVDSGYEEALKEVIRDDPKNELLSNAASPVEVEDFNSNSYQDNSWAEDEVFDVEDNCDKTKATVKDCMERMEREAKERVSVVEEFEEVVSNNDEYFEMDDIQKFDEERVINVDLRLRTFQDMGRLCRLYPGAYYDHDLNAWFCRKCQAFSFPGSASNPWISTGVRLGDHPSRKMKKHFDSSLHKQCIATEKTFQKPSVH